MLYGVLQVLLTLKLVSASLYPIEPIQNTVYYSGQTSLTRWIDDGTYPLLSNMGGITIQLYCNSDTYLATLATNVSAEAETCELDIPQSLSLVHDASNFTLRYVTHIPYDMIIYSADFAIVARGDSLPAGTNTNATRGSSSTTSTQNLFFQATNSLMSSSTPSPTSIVMPPLRPDDIGNVNQPSRSAGSAGRIDIEKLKFRVVFILWPALLGVTMAL
ncbi:hypothetical protein BDR07DRAFT_1608322 [Suillus spraguei]|nr:hypothetical protein BDR07DRAFT_1461807 [Suillus spraguei]KAG2364171.1 hypothetical protein BDR07DRAFT_1608322 [Suillus spraguei]